VFLAGLEDSSTRWNSTSSTCNVPTGRPLPRPAASRALTGARHGLPCPPQPQVRLPSCPLRVVTNALGNKITSIVAIRASRKAWELGADMQRALIIGNGGIVYGPWSVVRRGSAVVRPDWPRVQRGTTSDRASAEASSAPSSRRPNKCDERTQKLRSRLALRVVTKRALLRANGSLQTPCWHDVQTSRIFGETKPFGITCPRGVAGRRL
jgi:hypothetical protein